VKHPMGEESTGASAPCWETMKGTFICGMKIRVSDPRLVDDLLESLRRAHCDVEVTGPATIAISSPSRLLTAEQARREIGFYLAVWLVRHPGTRVVVLD